MAFLYWEWTLFIIRNLKTYSTPTLRNVECKYNTPALSYVIGFQHQESSAENVNTTSEAAQRLKKVLILSKHYDHHDYSDALSITTAVIILFPFIPPRLSFFSTSFSSHLLFLCLADRQKFTHTDTETHTGRLCVGQCSNGGCRQEQRSAAPCYYPLSPALFKGNAVAHWVTAQWKACWELTSRWGVRWARGRTHTEGRGQIDTGRHTQMQSVCREWKQARNKTCKYTSKHAHMQACTAVHTHKHICWLW